MSEERVTVAELMARRQAEGSTPDAPRRRRRRSLEEGGVSVQELTGSIPRVKAEGPRRGSHALSSDEDEPTVVAEATESAESAEAPLVDDVATGAAPESSDGETQDAAADAAAEVEPEAAAETEAAAAEVEPEAEPDVAAETVAEVDADAIAAETNTVETDTVETDAVETDAVASEVADPAVASSEAAPAVEPEEAAEADIAAEAAATPEPAAEAAPVADAEALPAVATLPMVVPTLPRPVMVNAERSEITYTFTSLVDATTGDELPGGAGPVARAVLTGSNSYDDRPTATIPVVDTDEPETAVIERAELGTTEADATEVDATEVDVPAVEAPADTAVAARAEVPEQPAAAPVAEMPDTEPVGTAAPAKAVAEAEPTLSMSAPPEAPATPAQPSEVAVPSESDDVAKQEITEDNSLSVPLLIVQVIVGLVVGAMVFTGFMMAWQSFSQIAVAVMAVVLTVVFVALANRLRRPGDTFTVVMAGIVGLALTFGPWLLLQR